MTASQILRDALNATDVMDEPPQPNGLTVFHGNTVTKHYSDGNVASISVTKRRGRGGRRSWSRVTENTVTATDKGIKLQFAAKPSDEVLAELKSSRWWFTQGYWLHVRTADAITQAYRLARA